MPIQCPLCLTIRRSMHDMRRSGLTNNSVDKDLLPRSELIKRVGADLHQSLSNPPLVLALVGLESRAKMRQKMFSRLNFFPSLANLLSQDRSFVIDVLLEACSLFDRGILEHQKRVAQLSVTVAKRLDLSQKTIKWLDITGKLHDIGKMAVKNIWKERRRLTKDESLLKEAHLTIALEFFSMIASLREVVNILRYNHYMDGYPAGIGEEDVPLEGQILSVVDTCDALIYDRPYHKGCSPRDALDIIRNKSRSAMVKTPYSPMLLAALEKSVLSQSHQV